MLVNIGKYTGFCLYLRSYLLCSPVLVRHWKGWNISTRACVFSPASYVRAKRDSYSSSVMIVLACLAQYQVCVLLHIDRSFYTSASSTRIVLHPTRYMEMYRRERWVRLEGCDRFSEPVLSASVRARGARVGQWRRLTFYFGKTL